MELREELQREGHVFATRSDAEVLLHAYRQWGVKCFERLQGFWALALWDRERRSRLQWQMRYRLDYRWRAL